jgi:hypothetical protein
MRRKSKFDTRIDIRMTKEQFERLLDKADQENITPNQVVRNLIDEIE